jgi:hypothetical protein
MSIGDKVWLVTVTTEPAEETEGNPSLTGYFLHASRSHSIALSLSYQRI